MKLTAPDMLKEKLIDGIIEEPLYGCSLRAGSCFPECKKYNPEQH